jgi:hypothetical protein
MFPSRKDIIKALKERGTSVLPVTFGKKDPEAMLILVPGGIALFTCEIVDDDPLPRAKKELWKVSDLDELVEKLDRERWDKSPA